MSGIQAQAALHLTVAPTLGSHAVNKLYVDNKFAAIPASNFTSGVIPHSRLPAFTGNVTIAAGASAAVLTPTGVTAGTYTMLNVNAGGYAVGGRQLQTSDITSVPWSKVTTGRPDTAAGYQLYDIFGRSGGSVYSGNVSSTATPAQSAHAITKDYVDVLLQNNPIQVLPIGSVVRYVGETRPDPEYLRCNGGLLLKAEYPALYDKVGDDHSAGLGYASGKPWAMQYNYNFGTGPVTGFTTSQGPIIPNGTCYSNVIVTKDKVHALGGMSGSNQVDTIYTATLADDGSLGAWTLTGNLPVNIAWSATVLVRNRVYVIGGINSATAGFPSYPGYHVYSAPVNADGTLGTWRAEASLPGERYQHRAVVIKNYIYVLGGQAVSGYRYTIYRTRIGEDGTLGAWQAYERAMPAGVSITAVAVVKNRLFTLGAMGHESTNGRIFYSEIDANGSLGPWTQNGISFAVPHVPSDIVVTNNSIYAFGAWSGSYSAVQHATITADGFFWNFSSKGNMPVGMASASVAVTRGKVHLIAPNVMSTAPNTPTYAIAMTGGKNDYSQYYNTVGAVQGAVEIPGNGQPWQQQHEINPTQSSVLGVWTTSGNIPEKRHHHRVFVTKNRVYMYGGHTAPDDSSPSAPAMTGYTAPINSNGTLGTWTVAPAMTGQRTGHEFVTIGNYVYAIGGAAIDTGYATVIRASIGEDGVIGPWTDQGQTPFTFQYGNVVVTLTRVYLICAEQTAYADRLADGRLSDWHVVDLNHPVISDRALIHTGDKVHLVGGNDGFAYSDTVSRVHTATVNADGSLTPFTEGTSLPIDIQTAKAYVTSNTAYVMGGRRSAEDSDIVLTASIDGSGNLGGWVNSSNLLHAMTHFDVFATQGYLYLVGGMANPDEFTTVRSNEILSTPISGGMNDLSNYYRTNVELTGDKYFGLPDYSTMEAMNPGLNYFIKVK